MATKRQLSIMAAEGVCFAYILLFVYAATNKLLDFENFQVQLAQSPLLSSFATPVSYAVPLVEFLLAVALSFGRTRRIALYCSFGLMVMFTAYIVIILKFSPFVPCSCGGILEQLTWKKHLIFNIAFALLGIGGLFALPSAAEPTRPARFIAASVLGITLSGCAVMTLLFLISEDMMHHRNNFTRRFPHHPAAFVRELKLGSYSYYIAGTDRGKLYLGDLNDPLKVTEIDSALQQKTVHRIAVDDPEREYQTLRLDVRPPYFYLSDGIKAFIYRGLTADWYGKIWSDQDVFFNAFAPIDQHSACIRALSSENGQNVLGLIQKGEPAKVVLKNGLLDTQIDGVFDTDGRLLYNATLRKIIYVYTYRNEFLITDTSLSAKDLGHTIDTTTRAKIKVSYIKSSRSTKLSSPARTVNKFAATQGEYLYIKSNLIGQYEPKSMWDEASIIDVYQLTTHAYLFSFYLYDKDGKKVHEFVGDADRIYALAGQTLTLYRLDPIAFERNR